ncbi:MAG TPA: dehydrogenase, partial [Leeuwenhoekiella sp.]|nr:dehydrogenase [Leeuwenhoekiella sp.]
RGHEEASGVKYVPEALLDNWVLRDPVTNFESYLIEKGLLNEALKQDVEDKIHQEIEQALQKVATEPAVNADLHTELNDVFAPVEFIQIKPGEATQQVRFIDAIQLGLRQSLERFENLILMGQDVAAYGGVFKITEGFVEQFGSERIRNTPICESAIVETAMGLAINGYKAIVEMQFADFVSSGFNPIVNYLAKSYYRWGQSADVVIRMPCGAGVGAGPFHSQTNEAWFTHTAGLKVVYPAFPYDAKGLLAAAIEDQNPVLFFEHKALYRTITQEIPEDYYTLPLGKASVVQEGSKITLITYGAPVHWAIEVLNDHKDWSVELIDLRSLIPLDYDTIKASVAKTGKVLLVTEDVNFGSITADISAYIADECFTYLDAPIKRLSSLDTPIPFAQPLENQYLAKRKLAEAIEALLAY